MAVFYTTFSLGSCPAHSILIILASVKYLTHSFSLLFVDYYVPTLSFSSPNSLMLLTHICYLVELPDQFLKKQLTDFFFTFNQLFIYLNYVNCLLVAIV